MYKIEITHQYLKDVKLARKRQLDENKLNQIIQLLAIGQALPLKNKDHALTGTYSGFRECHIQPDWLLIYYYEEPDIIVFSRTGTHSSLF